jgi:hypothetical protein
VKKQEKTRKKNKNSHNSLIKFIFSKFLKCVCVEMKSILEKYEKHSFFLPNAKIIFAKKENFGGGGKTFFIFLLFSK